MLVSIRFHSDGRGGPSRFIVPGLMMVAGGAIIAWTYMQPTGFTGWERWVPWLFGGLFLVSGARSLLGEFRRDREEEDAQRRLDEHRDAPWRVRPEWQTNELTAGAPVSRFLIVFALFWNAVSWPAAVLLIRSEFQSAGETPGSVDPAVWAMALFPAVGLVVAARVAYQLFRAWKYGRTRVSLDALPLRLGETGGGRMRVKMRRTALPADGFLMKVSCYRQRVRYERGTDGKRKRRIVRDLLWRDEVRQEGDPAMDGTAVEVPFAFTLPGDMPPSDPLKREERILWEVSGEADVKGIDFRAAVEVPVFPGEAGTGAGGSEAPGLAGAPAGDDVPPLDRPLSPGIVLVDEPEAFELHFTAARKRKGAILLGVIGTVFLLIGVPLLGASFLVAIVFVLVGGFLVYGSIQQGTNDTVLQVRDGRLSVAHDGVGMPADVDFDVALVEEVKVELGRTSSDNARYAIHIVARKGEGLEALGAQAERAMAIVSKLGAGQDHPVMEAMQDGAGRPRIPVADDFRDKAEAEWLAARIRTAVAREVGRAGSM